MKLNELTDHLEQFSKEYRFTYTVGGGAAADDISVIELCLGVALPDQARNFYSNFNGLKVDYPGLEIFPLQKLRFVEPNRLYFAVLDNQVRLFFDTSDINSAGQWNIVTSNGFVVTMTMASFWSNKIWMWLKHRKAIWKEEITEDCPHPASRDEGR